MWYNSLRILSAWASDKVHLCAYSKDFYRNPKVFCLEESLLENQLEVLRAPRYCEHAAAHDRLMTQHFEFVLLRAARYYEHAAVHDRSMAPARRQLASIQHNRAICLGRGMSIDELVLGRAQLLRIASGSYPRGSSAPSRKHLS